MADYATRRTMMVDTQVRPSDVTKFPIIEAMLHVPREQYLPGALAEVAYIGDNIDLGAGRVALEPRTLAKMLDALDIQPTDVVLDLGCGQGYSTAIMARLAKTVVGVESDAVHATQAHRNLTAHAVTNASVRVGSLAAGNPKSGPYDVIILQGAAVQVPAEILAQLREGGRIGAIFAEGSLGVVRVGHKTGGQVDWRFAFNAGAPVMAGFEAASGFIL